MSFVHTIYLENGYRFSVPDNDLVDVAEDEKYLTLEILDKINVIIQ